MTETRSDDGLGFLWLRLKIFALAALLSDAFYLAACYAIDRYAANGGFDGFLEAGGSGFVPLLRAVLLAASVPILIGAFVSKSMVKRRVGSGPRGPDPAPPDALEAEAVARLSTATMVSMALADAVGVFGVVLFLMAGGLAWFGVFLGPSFLAKLVLMPRRGELEEMILEADEEVRRSRDA